MAFSVACASADELHQLFVPGCEGRIDDILIDASGVIAGIAVAALVFFDFTQARASVSAPNRPRPNLT